MLFFRAMLRTRPKGEVCPLPGAPATPRSARGAAPPCQGRLAPPGPHPPADPPTPTSSRLTDQCTQGIQVQTQCTLQYTNTAVHLVNYNVLSVLTKTYISLKLTFF